MQGRQYDQDDLICAISYQKIRHPVRVFPSEKIYELDSLLKMRQTGLAWKCPITRTNIDAIGYDTELKNHLDNNDEDDENRYPEYSSFNALVKLHLYAKSHSIHVALNVISANLPSLIISGATFSLLKIINLSPYCLDNKNLEYFLYAAATGATDLALKYKTHSQVGLFRLIPTLISNMNCCIRVVSDEEEEESDMFDLRI